MYQERGAVDRTTFYAERAIRAATRLGDPARIAAVMGRLGDVAFFTGEWEQARGRYEHAEAMYRAISMAPISNFCAGLFLQLGRLCMAQGDREAGFRYLEESRILYAPHGKRSGLREVQSQLAERDLRDGQAEAARARLLPLLDRQGVEEHHVTTQILPWLAWSYLELGDIAQAGHVAAAAIRRARVQHDRLTLVDALRVQAMVAGRQGRRDEAVTALEEGLSLTRSISYPYGEGRLLHLYGAMDVQQGEPEAEREKLVPEVGVVGPRLQRTGSGKPPPGTPHQLHRTPGIAQADL
jgi:tetratricopeptide (TPR) repeat protein